MASATEHPSTKGPEAHESHEPFDPEPVTALSPGEPKTPTWIPIVGAVLFVLAGVYLLISGDDAQSDETRQVVTQRQATALPAQQRPAKQRARRPSRKKSLSGALNKLNAKDKEAFQRKLEQLKEQVGFEKHNHLPKKP